MSRPKHMRTKKELERASSFEPTEVDSVATTFPQFRNLPESIRFNIWRQTTSVPRTVEFFESHDVDMIGSFFDDASEYGIEKTMTTNMYSRTRPPAILAVSREARKLGLTVYTRMDEGVRSKSITDTPIYINPEVDIMYRGKLACQNGDAFRIRVKNWISDTKPLAVARILAVDALTLIHEKPTIASQLLEHIGLAFLKDNSFNTPDYILRGLAANRMTDIARCVEKGLQEILIVIGNDDDLSEVNFIPYNASNPYIPRYDAKIIKNTEKLQQDLDQYWKEQKLEIPQPTIKLVTVQRLPLKSFSLFPKLPVELQSLVWKAAYGVPRLVTISYDDVVEETLFAKPRVPALAQVCQESRRLFTGQLILNKDIRGGVYFEREVDTLLLDFPRATDRKIFNKINVPSIALQFSQCGQNIYEFTAADAKTYTHLKEIIILIGPARARCELTYHLIDECLRVDSREALDWDDRMWSDYWGAEFYVKDLRNEMQKRLKAWKAYQKRREKDGKSSPDWEVPVVKLACIKTITETVSPYLY